MKSLVGNDKYLKFNLEIDWEPVETHKNRCIMKELGRERNTPTRAWVSHILPIYNLCIFGWGCAAGTLKPLHYTKPCSADLAILY